MPTRPAILERNNVTFTAAIDQHRAAAHGCAFLRERQLPSGQFRIDISDDGVRNGEWSSDPTVFATSVVACNVMDLPGRDAATVSRRSAGFLRGAMEAAGVWRFWTDEHMWARMIPFDSDDTACAAMALRPHGGAPHSTGRALLANRGQHGLFYTWLVPHPGVWPGEPAYWRAALSGVRVPVQRRAFWRLTAADPDDVDAVVCANVLAFLGDRPETVATAAYLAEILRAGREAACDKWYHRPLAVHHAVARAFGCGATSLASARDVAVRRIMEHRRASGEFGNGPLDTSLAVCALRDWGYESRLLDEPVESLLSTQQTDGSWAREIYYVGGPKATARWGSPEVTTAFCVRALTSVASRL